MDNLIQTLSISILPVLFAITLHEAAHGYAARHFGDNTAWQAGRISLNPLRHIDLWGTVILPLLILLLSGSKFIFGYAKPVPVNPSHLRRPRQDMLWVAAAGPIANLLMALGWAALMKLGFMLPVSSYTIPLIEMSNIGIEVNLVLMTLNLLPLPPLDGGRIAVSLLPQHLAWRYARLEPYGFAILLLLLFTDLLGMILFPLVEALRGLIELLFQIY